MNDAVVAVNADLDVRMHAETDQDGVSVSPTLFRIRCPVLSAAILTRR